jgi:outer membrane protein TolC
VRVLVSAWLYAALLPGATLVRADDAARVLTLDQALQRAFAAHPDLRVAAADLAMARADSAFAATRAFNPTLEASSTRGGASLASGAENTLELGVSQEFEARGQRAARQAVTAARVQTLAAQWRAQRQDVEAQVRACFARALFLQERLALVDTLAGLDRVAVLATRARVREGSITPVTGRLTELDLLRLDAQVLRVRSDLRQARVALGTAMAQPLPADWELRGDVRVDTLAAPVDSVVTWALRARASRDVFRRRIDERRAELQQEQANARSGFTLGLGVAREQRAIAHEDFSGVSDIVNGIAGARSVDHLWTARISAPLPLWQKNQAGRARAAAAIDRSLADEDRDRLQLQQQVLAATLRFQDAALLYQLYRERSVRVRQDLALVRDAYADGRIALDSYLTQKGRLVDTLLGEWEAGEAYWDARAQFETAAGSDLAHVNAGGER